MPDMAVKRGKRPSRKQAGCSLESAKPASTLGARIADEGNGTALGQKIPVMPNAVFQMLYFKYCKHQGNSHQISSSLRSNPLSIFILFIAPHSPPGRPRPAAAPPSARGRPQPTASASPRCRPPGLPAEPCHGAGTECRGRRMFVLLLMYDGVLFGDINDDPANNSRKHTDGGQTHERPVARPRPSLHLDGVMMAMEEGHAARGRPP